MLRTTSWHFRNSTLLTAHCARDGVVNISYTNFPLQRCEKVSSQDKKVLFLFANFFPVGYKPEEPNNAQQTMYYTLWEMKDKEKRGAEEVRGFCCLSFMVDKFLILIISNDLNISLPHVAKANISNFESHSRNRGNIISVPLRRRAKKSVWMICSLLK